MTLSVLVLVLVLISSVCKRVCQFIYTRLKVIGQCHSLCYSAVTLDSAHQLNSAREGAGCRGNGGNCQKEMKLLSDSILLWFPNVIHMVSRPSSACGNTGKWVTLSQGEKCTQVFYCYFVLTQAYSKH